MPLQPEMHIASKLTGDANKVTCNTFFLPDSQGRQTKTLDNVPICMGPELRQSHVWYPR